MGNCVEGAEQLLAGGSSLSLGRHAAVAHGNHEQGLEGKVCVVAGGMEVRVGNGELVQQLLYAVAVVQLERVLGSLDRVHDVGGPGSDFGVQVIQELDLLARAVGDEHVGPARGEAGESGGEVGKRDALRVPEEERPGGPPAWPRVCVDELVRGDGGGGIAELRGDEVARVQDGDANVEALTWGNDFVAPACVDVYGHEEDVFDVGSGEGVADWGQVVWRNGEEGFEAVS